MNARETAFSPASRSARLQQMLLGSELEFMMEAPQEKIRIYDRGMEFTTPESFGEYQLSYRSGDILSPQIDATEPIVTELREFVRLIRAREVSGHLELGRQVVMLAEAAEASLASGGAPVALASQYESSLV